MKLCSPHLHDFGSHSLRPLVLLEDPGEDCGPPVHLGQRLNPHDTEPSLQLPEPVETQEEERETLYTARPCADTAGCLLCYRWSSSSMQARLSRPLSHVSKAAWKSLRTVICSAAVSNMPSSRVAEGAGGGLQLGPRRRAAAMLVGQQLVSHRHTKNKLLKTSLTPPVSRPNTCLTPTRVFVCSLMSVDRP